MVEEQPRHRLGTVVCTNDGPNVMEFAFVLEGGSNETTVRRGEFVTVATDFGIVVAMVQDLVRTNRYFQHAEAVREYQSRGEPLRSIFPTDRWQYTIAETRVVGFWINERTVRPYTTVSPGAVVRRADEDMLAKFLRLDTKGGLRLGKVANHELEFRASIDRLLSKHLAILAMSGAGKSYFVSVMLEEILARTEEQGRLSVVVVDVHGEYTYLKDLKPESLGLPAGSFEVEHIRGSHVQIPVRNLSAEGIGAYVAGMSGVQIRDLRRAISDIRTRFKDGYTLKDLITLVKDDETISKNTREALVGWLINLEDTGLFGK
ncbi:MAG: ATP-binding protein, partial [Candidatus Thorarchaeota archaeon]